MVVQTKKGKIEAEIDWMKPRHMNEVCNIEWRSFEFPWSKKDFCYCLRHTNKANQNDCKAIVAKHDDKIIGFLIYQKLTNHLHILSFAVDPDYRRKTVGHQIIDTVVNHIYFPPPHLISLDVKETNLPTQLFLRAQGFRAVATFHNFYEEITDDAYRMEYRHIDLTNTS